MACLVIKLVNDSMYANIIIYNDYISHFVMALLFLTNHKAYNNGGAAVT